MLVECPGHPKSVRGPVDVRPRRALPQIITIVDLSQGLGQTDVVTVNADQTLELSPARANDWGPDAAAARDTDRER